MKYEYQGIKLGDTIEKIIHLLNNKNTKCTDPKKLDKLI